MESIPDTYSPIIVFFLSISGLSFSTGFIINLFILAVLFFFSAMASASEAAFFSLSPPQVASLKESASGMAKKILRLLQNPNRLLATLLIANCMANIAIVLLSTFIVNSVVDLSEHPFAAFLAEVVVITFLLLVLGEVTPKVYAAKNNLKTATRLTYPLFFLNKLFTPVTSVLISSVSFFEKNHRKSGYSVSVDQLSHALDMTSAGSSSAQEQKMLKGIVTLGRTEVRQIMTPRMDIAALNVNVSYAHILETILETGFSRMPVYSKGMDNIVGILYIKDLLYYINESYSFNWQQLLRPPFIVPETQKIDDLLKTFQKNRIHLAIVVDEYGSTSGIVTLEDIIEEIVGEISDEFDDDNLVYSKLDSQNYLFYGKTSLHDVCRITGIDFRVFEKTNTTSVTLGGFLIERYGVIPEKNRLIEFGSIRFKIEASDSKKIELVKISL